MASKAGLSSLLFPELPDATHRTTGGHGGAQGLGLELDGERMNTPTMSCRAGLDWEELGDCQEQ